MSTLVAISLTHRPTSDVTSEEVWELLMNHQEELHFTGFCLFVLCLNTVQFSYICKYLDGCTIFCNLAAVHGNKGFEVKQLE